MQPLIQWMSFIIVYPSVCICSFSYKACNVRAIYWLVWPVRMWRNFPHYLLNGTIFERKLPNTKYVFRFSLQLLSEIFLILRMNERDIIKKIFTFK